MWAKWKCYFLFQCFPHTVLTSRLCSPGCSRWLKSSLQSGSLIPFPASFKEKQHWYEPKIFLLWVLSLSHFHPSCLRQQKKQQPMALVLYWKTCDRQPRGANWLVSGRRQCLLDLFLNPLLPVLTLSASLCFPNKRLLPPGPPLPGVQSLHSHSRTCSLPLY